MGDMWRIKHYSDLSGVWTERNYGPYVLSIEIVEDTVQYRIWICPFDDEMDSYCLAPIRNLEEAKLVAEEAALQMIIDEYGVNTASLALL